MGRVLADLGCRRRSLLITRRHAAIDPLEARGRVARLLSDGVAVPQSGRDPLRADCISIHSDTPGTAELGKAIDAEPAAADTAAES
jgi:5-oxoprolinase (ATP-hydrolysing) subunit A